ncbi:MAG TPA: class I mannose-6-phosphate isomerase, partial [Chloroflexota bacterium]|nr:class I mannose-6-phosphate isomerase [Chloroflexota bacterium]
AQENLSVQVHPNDAYARATEAQPFGKSEMWYVVEARPGAVLFQGLSHAMTPAEFRSALKSGTIVDHLAVIEVKPGDVLVNAPGTIHALGGGIVIYELQQSSDLTYRLYDWDRASTAAKRPLHIEKAVDVVDYSPLAVHQVRAIRLTESNQDRQFLGASRYYAAELWTIDESEIVAAHRDRFELITLLQGRAQIQVAGASPASAILAAGESALIPAGVATYRLVSTGKSARMIRSYVPDLRRDIVDPLRAAGVSDDEIVQLGGDPRTSDLAAAVRGSAIG